MANDDMFKVHDITVRETQTVSQAGTVTKQEIVTFYVGPNGPFTVEFEPGKYTPEQARQAIDAKVQALRIIHGAY